MKPAANARMVLLHIAIILSAVFIMLFNSPMPLMLLLVGFKMVIDLFFHNRAHRAKPGEAYNVTA